MQYLIVIFWRARVGRTPRSACPAPRPAPGSVRRTPPASERPPARNRPPPGTRAGQGASHGERSCSTDTAPPRMPARTGHPMPAACEPPRSPRALARLLAVLLAAAAVAGAREARALDPAKDLTQYVRDGWQEQAGLS